MLSTPIPNSQFHFPKIPIINPNHRSDKNGWIAQWQSAGWRMLSTGSKVRIFLHPQKVRLADMAVCIRLQIERRKFESSARLNYPLLVIARYKARRGQGWGECDEVGESWRSVKPLPSGWISSPDSYRDYHSHNGESPVGRGCCLENRLFANSGSRVPTMNVGMLIEASAFESLSLRIVEQRTERWMERRKGRWSESLQLVT